MDMFALLHRQSRMSNVELAAEAKHWDSEACSATVMPPVDYSAAEETPASVVILCVMAVIEEHLRRAECGGQISGAERPPRLHRRLQISVKLLALQLLAAFMDLQRNDERSQCSRSSSASALDPRQEHDVQESNHDDRSTTVGDTDVCRITRSVYLLTAHQLDELHRWLHCCLHEMIISPFSPYTTGTTAVDGKDGCGSRCGEAGDPIAGSPLAALKSQATAYLTRVLESPAHGMDVPANMLGMVSLNTFVAFMERLAAIVVAHQQTAVAMAISLSARLPPTATASEGEAQLPAWVMENISKCADAVAHQQTALQDGSMPDPIASTVPLVCRVYVNQLSELLAPFQRDVLAHVSREQQEADSPCDTLRKGILCKLQRRLLSWVTQAEHRHAKTQTRLTADSFSPAVVAAEVVSAWVSHVCEAYTVTLYLN
ncbi:hypothetical protein, unknown function [Leishmania tarentolae]|uniref:Uncharacterized protein n=1 Tax=Leishmania tarentolae TaxID=5689 RepID=A0A640KAB9_LEITA|nr:hypothetical protein, unknown function [Leishmania tarentolae]